MALNELLLEILVDPEDKLPLWYFEQDAVLYNPRLLRRYDINDGIPVLLVSEATALDGEAAASYESRQSEAKITGRGAAS